jgi:hypothetical protein
LVASFSTSMNAQTQVAQPAPQATLESVALSLPDAPVPQNGTGSAAPTAGQPTGPAATAPASSSSQQSAPAAPAAAPADPPAAPLSAADAKQKQHEEAERELKVQEKQRLLGVMPQFQVVMNGHAVPSNRRRKVEVLRCTPRSIRFISAGRS